MRTKENKDECAADCPVAVDDDDGGSTSRCWHKPRDAICEHGGFGEGGGSMSGMSSSAIIAPSSVDRTAVDSGIKISI